MSISNSKSPSRTQLVVDLLTKSGHAMNIVEISSSLKIPVNKLRSSLSNYCSPVVRVGNLIFDLRSRAYHGKQIRVKPSLNDIKQGKLSLYEDESVFFEGMLYSYESNITLIGDSGKISIVLKKSRKPPLDRVATNLKSWYRQVTFKPGDDIIFTCLNIEKFEFKIEKQAKNDREEHLISKANHLLADAASVALDREHRKYGMDMFMIRNYFYLFNAPVPPDPLLEVLASDSRFIDNFNYKCTNDDGLVFDQDIPAHGLRKYYYLHHKGVYVNVPILTDDEYGERYGACSLCWDRMIWEPLGGWRHCADEFEWTETEVPREFKTFVPSTITNSQFDTASQHHRPCTHNPSVDEPIENQCFLCGQTKNLVQTECCGHWICDDEDNYQLFSYARNSCHRNHRRYTLCSHHYAEQHEGDWKTCKECLHSFDTEDHVWYGTNEYNFEKLPHPPKFKPTICAKCLRAIRRGDEGYTCNPDGTYLCEKCGTIEMMRRN